MISDKTIEDVLLATDLVQLVREYAPDLQKRGRDYVCRCPFHQENTASFHVSPERGYWRCFGACQTGGDAIKFVMLHDGLAFPQAVEFLARRAGIMIEEEPLTEAQAATARRKQAMMELNGRVAAWYQEQLHSEAGAAALEYARGLFGDDEPERASMGYAPRSGDALYRWARATGESLELLEELHLIARNKEQGTFYDFMRDRIVYPIRDARRNVIGFTARDLSGQSPAKYVNSAESEVYHLSLYTSDAADDLLCVDLGGRRIIKKKKKKNKKKKQKKQKKKKKKHKNTPQTPSNTTQTKTHRIKTTTKQA